LVTFWYALICLVGLYSLHVAVIPQGLKIAAQVILLLLAPLLYWFESRRTQSKSARWNYTTGYIILVATLIGVLITGY